MILVRVISSHKMLEDSHRNFIGKLHKNKEKLFYIKWL